MAALTSMHTHVKWFYFQIRGIKELVFYSLPENAEFYAEVCWNNDSLLQHFVCYNLKHGLKVAANYETVCYLFAPTF